MEGAATYARVVVQIHTNQSEILCVVVCARVGAILITANVEVFCVCLGHDPVEFECGNVVAVKSGEKPGRVGSALGGKDVNRVAVITHHRGPTGRKYNE